MSDHAVAQVAAAPRLSQTALGLPGGTVLNIVIVDDQASARTLLHHAVIDLPFDLDIHEFGNPTDALLWCARHPVDLLLLDYRMPGVDGLEFAKRIRGYGSHRTTPIILITVVPDLSLRDAALEVGALDVMVKPIQPALLRARCRQLLSLRQADHDQQRRLAALEIQIAHSQTDLEVRERETLSRLARAVELRDAGAGADLARIAAIAGLLARRLGLSSEQARTMELAAPLHDIGKIAIPDSILMKPGRLDPDEFEVIKHHTVLGHKLLAESQSPIIQVGATIALSHHERFDGTGYPHRLRGEDIPLPARIVAVADVLDALISHRPYRTAAPTGTALAYIATQRGTHFDPTCVDALLDQRAEVQALCAPPQAQDNPPPAPRKVRSRGAAVAEDDLAASSG